MNDIYLSLVHLARLAIDGRTDDVKALVRKVIRKIAEERPDLSHLIDPIIKNLQVSSPTRSVAIRPLPVDSDSRLELIRKEAFPNIPIEPTWPPSVRKELNSIISERVQEQQLLDVGLSPTKTVLLVGPPGVGKTLAARWLSIHIGRPLLTLDLAAVMSSFLGKTGNNIRAVLDYARQSPSILLLDEFDAIAKRRDDTTEIGELKRLVTVLLQAVDDWPAGGLLLAATNHDELLDPAVWRRFDRVIQFPMPDINDIRMVTSSLLKGEVSFSEKEIELYAYLFAGKSFADITRLINTAKRESIISKIPLNKIIAQQNDLMVKTQCTETKLRLALALDEKGMSQREISQITGLSRDTIRRHGHKDKKLSN